MTRFRVGIIGATGYIAAAYRTEIRAAPDQAQIVSLCARRRPLLEEAAREDGATHITEDWREVVHHPDVDVVVIATPDAQHYEAVMAAAAAGKHIVCEKPVGMNAAEAGAMWQAVRERKLAHFVPFWTRYAVPFAHARDVVQAGTLGEVHGVIARWHNPRPPSMPFTWRDDAEQSAAGSLADVGSHSYDTMRWLLKQDAARVLTHADVLTPAKPDLGEVNLGEALRWGGEHADGEAEKRRKATAFDFADVALVFANGAIGSLVLSHAPFLRRGLSPDLELHGTEASLAIDRLSGRLILARTGKDNEVLMTVPDPGNTNRFATHVFPALRQQLAGEPVEFPGMDDGYHVQQFTDAAAESARSGRWAEVRV